MCEIWESCKNQNSSKCWRCYNNLNIPENEDNTDCYIFNDWKDEDNDENIEE